MGLPGVGNNSGVLGVVAEGSYRIRVAGDAAAVATVADSFGVTPRV
jgi:hypothetical protein